MSFRCIPVLTALALLLLLPGLLPAQEVPVRRASGWEPATLPSPFEHEEPQVPSPVGAFTRSLLVPGWGQAALGSYFRGGVYFAAHTGSGYMMLKSAARLGQAREVERRRSARIEENLREEGESDPAVIADAVAADAIVAAARELASSRSQQREDWIAATLFWTLAGAVDAFVAAHLADFPTGINAERQRDGSFRFGVTIPAGDRR